jgi:dTDP-4-amino-4,6-dideoxygalactose transaminase
MTPKQQITDLGIFGGTPLFASPLRHGQLYMPEWHDFKKSFQGIFERRYFANHGPLVRDLDKKIAEYLGVRHAICVTNETIALMVAAKAIDLRGEIIVPAFTYPSSVQAMSWAGLTPVFCDVNSDTHTITAELISPLINDTTCAVLGMHTWGRPCDPENIMKLCQHHDISLIYDASDAFGCCCKNTRIANFGHVECFSFHSSKLVNGLEGGCLTTNDDELAARIRTVRNFHISESFSKVPLRINGKMSEAQASLVLLGLKNFDRNRDHNRSIFEAYQKQCKHIQGIKILEPITGTTSNYQDIVIEILNDKIPLTRDHLASILEAENIEVKKYFYPGVHNMMPYNLMPSSRKIKLKKTERLCNSLIQLPIGSKVSEDNVKNITKTINFIVKHSEKIAKKLS